MSSKLGDLRSQTGCLWLSFIHLTMFSLYYHMPGPAEIEISAVVADFLVDILFWEHCPCWTPVIMMGLHCTLSTLIRLP